MQRLGAAQSSRQTFQRGSDNIVIGILGRQAPARCLAMGAQHGGSRIFGIELADDFMPQEPRCPQHGNFHKKVHADSKEKRQPRRKLINIQTGIQSCPNIFQPVSQRKCRLQHGISPGFHHMVTADTDGVVAGHMA